MDEIPQEISDDLRNSIRAGLLRVHSKHLDQVSLTECLREASDVYAELVQRAGWPARHGFAPAEPAAIN